MMSMSNLFLAICCVLSSVSCKVSSKENVHNENDDTIDDSQTIIAQEIVTKEEFDQFLVQFNGDVKFQKKRVLFPLKYTNLANYETDEYDTVYIQSDNYEKYELISPKSNVVDGQVILRSDSISDSQHQLIMLVEDTGIRLEFLFIMKENLWYLFEIRNRST
jgi:hypothetical protein